MLDIIEYLRARYEVGENYARAYTEYWNNTGKTEISSPKHLEILREPESMWFEFALSANQRGRRLVQALGAEVARPGQRYLDIGCGFGGMLAAFSERGYEAHGIELDPVRVELAQANILDIGRGASVCTGSILDPNFIAQQQPYDVITCIDVIEHVADVPQTIAHAVALLAPEGALHLEVPNFEAIDFVISDGHFSLFGITLLQRWAAIEYQRANLGYEYDVGDFYPLDYYVAMLRSYGLTVSSSPSPLQSPVSWKLARNKAEELLSNLDKLLAAAMPKVPERVKPYLKSAVEGYRLALRTELDDAIMALSAGARERFTNRFGANFWLISAAKQGDPRDA